MVQVASISQQIWDMKYRLKTADGEPVDRTIEDSWRRVARNLASVETDSELWEERFYEALSDFKFLPAGRILSGAGTERNVTLFNCFVQGDIPDDMAGIFDSLKEAALTMQQGGGIGYDFSTLRPKGARVHGVGADASGPLSFMDVWDAMCRTIMSAGSRRGAMMGTMRCDHPDIEAFIEAKRDPGRMRMFNLSVLVTDPFMTAVREDADWNLEFKGTVYNTVKAKDLWDKIMRSTYDYAEPGVIFIDRINRLNNLWYAEEIHATNPCVTGDTWVLTTDGPKQVAELIGKPFQAQVDGKTFASAPEGFFKTGNKPVLRLQTKEGPSLRLTEDHLVLKVAKRTRWRMETEWIKAGKLAPGDEIRLHAQSPSALWNGEYTEAEGYLIGLLLGDGTLKKDKAVLSVWPGQKAINGGAETPGALGIMKTAEAAARTLPHRSDFEGWISVKGREEYRLSIAAIKDLAENLGILPGDKKITPEIERASSSFYLGFLRGLFDADGSVQGTQAKGVSVRLAQSNISTLEATQRMLLRLGIASTLYRERRQEGTSFLPDGKGGNKHYNVQAQHELVIAGDNLQRFQALIGFADTDKATRLQNRLAQYKRALNREQFIATVVSVMPDGKEDVFDVQVPGINAFDANGLYVHNCGEQPLPPYGTCLLGSVNLARLVSEPFTPEARIDEEELARLVAVAVRMMDNVIDVSNYPLPQHRAEAESKRRIGLGITGLADALIMCGARYGAARSVDLTDTWLSTIRRAAYLASAELAKEKGAFPLFDMEKHLEGEFIGQLDDEVCDVIAANGIRNSHLISIAPTGTISLYADNVSSGLEPVFSFSYTRNVLMPDGSRKEEEVSDFALRAFKQICGDSAPLTDAFVDTQVLSPRDHLVMQAKIQEYVDSSISKTINCPEDISFEAFKEIYLEAYDLGCKGCTTYRPNDVTGSVLQVKPEKKAEDGQGELPLEMPTAKAEKKADNIGGVVHQMFQPLDRPEALPGATYKLAWPESDHAIYITLNDIVTDGRRRPFEVFINTKDTAHYAWTVALTRMISAVFRRGGDVSFVVEELKAVFDPRGGHWVGGKYIPSLLAAIGNVIENHMIAIGFIKTDDGPVAEAQPQVVAIGGGLVEADEETEIPKIDTPPSANTQKGFRNCPRCGQPSMIRQEGCDSCTSCGYSKCG